MTKILIINAGSSSVKFRLYDGDVIVLDGVVDRIGKDAVLEMAAGQRLAPEQHQQYVKAANHAQAGVVITDVLGDNAPDIIAHRVVYGADHTTPLRITEKAIGELKSYVPLAPLHMPPAIALIEFFHHRLGVEQVACFDTMFHAGMPEVAKTYAIPQDLAKKHGIVRRGFHGLAHEAMAVEAAKRASLDYKRSRIITCQLGNGASVCAILNGKSVETSMGFTPLEGLVMGTRSGDIDPAIIPFLIEHEHKTAAQILDLLEHESGLKGLAGASDVRDLLAREKKGDAQAKLALDVAAHRVKKYIGAYLAVLGGADLIVLGGGIPRAPAMRERILNGLEEFGIVLDARKVKDAAPALINKGRVQVWVIEPDEQEHMLKLVKGF